MRGWGGERAVASEHVNKYIFIQKTTHFRWLRESKILLFLFDKSIFRDLRLYHFFAIYFREVDFLIFVVAFIFIF